MNPFDPDFDMRTYLIEQGYTLLVERPGRGFCSIQRMFLTVGLLYGLQEFGYEGRYCFETAIEAEMSLAAWDGVGDPPGDWIKHKGRSGEWSNPKLQDDIV